MPYYNRDIIGIPKRGQNFDNQPCLPRSDLKADQAEQLVAQLRGALQREEFFHVSTLLSHVRVAA